MDTLTRIGQFLNKYRFDVYTLFAAILVINWSFYPLIIPDDVTDPRWVFGIAFMALYIWIFLFNKTCDRVEDSISQPNEVVSGSEIYTVQIVAWTMFVIGIGVPFVYGYNIIPLIVYAFFGAWYSYPFFGGFRLKNLFLVKNIAAAIINHLSPLLLAAYYYFQPFLQPGFTFDVYAFLGIATIFLTTELIWDIRDTKGDQQARVFTVPVVLGIFVTKALCFCLLIVSIWALPSMFFNQIIIIAFAFMAGLVDDGSPRYWFHLLLYFAGIVLLVAVVDLLLFW